MRPMLRPFALAALVIAGRALDEPPSIAKAAKSAQKSDVERVLKSANAWDRCKDALDDGFLIGVECRATLATALVRDKPMASSTGAKKADVDARTSLFADLVKVGANISSWDPLSPPPQMSRSKFDAHRAVSKALMALYDDVSSSSSDARAAFLATQPKTAACTAAQRTVELATGADASLEERGAAQSLLTSHSCFLDESRLEKAPTPGKALQDSKDAASLAASTSTSAAMRDYAQSRKLDLDRCVERHVSAAGKADDKLESCVCGAIGRWKFPAPGVDTDVPIPLGAGGLSVRVSAGANGSVHHCGPVVSGTSDAQ
jgi:hypothetical protein